MKLKKFNTPILLFSVLFSFMMLIYCVELDKDFDSLESKYVDYLNSASEAIKSQTEMIEGLEKEIEVLNNRLDNLMDLGYDYDYVQRVVAAECRGEPYEGQVAVCQVIKNRSEEWGYSPEVIVKQKNQFAPPVSSDKVTESVARACRAVFLDDEEVTEEPIKYFYSTAGGFYSRMHEEHKTFVLQIGNHKFYK